MRLLVLTIVAFLSLSGCSGTVSVPLTVDREVGYYSLEGKYERKEVRLLVDTGASLPVISSAFVDANGISSIEQAQLDGNGGSDAVGPLASDKPIVVTRPSTFSVGRVVFDPTGYFQVLDLDALNSVLRQRVDGVASSGVLNSATFYTLDFQQAKLTLGRARDTPKLRHKMVFDHQRPIVSVMINGTESEFFLDSGAIQSAISRETAANLLAESEIGAPKDYQLLSIDGLRPTKLSLARVKLLEFAGNCLQDATLYVGDRNLIGLDILRGGVLTVDPVMKRYAFVYPDKAVRPAVPCER